MNQINRWKSDGNGPSSDLLRTFCTVVELGNVTKAAARLGRTQSAISVQLRKLEEALGVRLLERGARGVVPTREGEKLQGLARDTVDRVDRIGTLFRRPLSGKIRVGIPDDYNETILERALARFVKRHAQVEVFIRAGCTAGFPAAIRDNTLDIALYGAEPLSEDQVVFSEPTVWAAAKDFDWDWAAWHAANNKQETEGEATGSLPLVLFDRPCGWRHVARDSLNAADLPWRVVYLSENFLSVRTAISAGLGVGILARSTMSPDLKILGDAEGLPLLPPSAHTILKRSPAAGLHNLHIPDESQPIRANQNASQEVIDAMETALREAIGAEAMKQALF